MEMLVVLALLGFMTALAAPALRDPSGKRVLDRTGREVAALLREARVEALLSGSDSLIFVDLEEKQISASWTEDRLKVLEEISIGVLTAREEVVLTGRPSLRFFADGSATGGAIRLETRETEILVSVDWLTGRVERKRAGP